MSFPVAIGSIRVISPRISKDIGPSGAEFSDFAYEHESRIASYHLKGFSIRPIESRSSLI